MITILGLGPGDPNLLTIGAQEELEQAREVYVRTREHPTVAALPNHLQVHTFDSIYEHEIDFEAIYQAIADEVLRLGRDGDILYAVPGHPLVGEISVHKILSAARQQGLEVRIIAGISFVDASLIALGLDPLDCGLQVVDATDLAREYFPRLDTDRPALVGQLYSRQVASDVKLTLLVNYPPDYPIKLVQRAGAPGTNVRTLSLAELDHGDDFGLMTTLYIPAYPEPSSPVSLADIVAHLRSPKGCPWDREQTPQSLRAALLEETYEVLEALDHDDLAGLREELGDVMLHVLFQAQMASEASEFTLADIGQELAAKLIRRHPHVFGDVQVSSPEEVIVNWNRIKAKEKAAAGQAPKPASPLTTVPRELPALARAQRIFEKAKHAGLVSKRAEPNPALQPLLAEARKLLRSTKRERNLGEVLFGLAALAADKELDAEGALRVYTEQFAQKATERKDGAD